MDNAEPGSFICSFSRCFLQARYVLSTLLGAGESVINETQSLHSSGGGTGKISVESVSAFCRGDVGMESSMGKAAIAPPPRG